MLEALNVFMLQFTTKIFLKSLWCSLRLSKNFIHLQLDPSPFQINMQLSFDLHYFGYVETYLDTFTFFPLLDIHLCYLIY